MRVLVAHPGPHFSVQDVYAGWVEALQSAGQHVVPFNLGDRLTFYSSVLLPEPGKTDVFKYVCTGPQAQELAVNGLYASLIKVRPHVLLLISGFFIPPELPEIARAAGVKVVLVCTESPYEDRRQALLAERCDLTIVNDPVNLNMYPKNTIYLPHAYRPGLHRPGPTVTEMVSDFAFVGTAYPSRIAFMEEMIGKLGNANVLLAGNWQALSKDSPIFPYLATEPDECIDNAATVNVYRSARVGLNLYRARSLDGDASREAELPEFADGWSMGPREVEMAACGLPFVRDRRGEGDEVLSMLPTFTGGPDGALEAAEHVMYLLSNPNVRDSLGQKAREAIADRTFDNHASRLLSILD